MEKCPECGSPIFKDEEIKEAVSSKRYATEMFVDAYRNKFKKPPTYQRVADFFNIGKTTAYMRLGRYRHKMKQQNK